MKIIPLVLSIFCAFFSIGQKSYYFSNSLPPAGNALNQVDPQYFGSYSSENGSMMYIMDEKGIRTESTNIASMSRETLRESSQYEVRNGHIFGVVAGDSVPCVLEGEYYYFGVRNRDVLVGEGSLHTLKYHQKGQYLLNFFENGDYIPVLLKFTANGLEMRGFDYDFETTIFDFIGSRELIADAGVSNVTLEPTQEEFERLMGTGIFGTAQNFEKEQE